MSRFFFLVQISTLFLYAPTMFANDSLQFNLDWEYLTFPDLPQAIVFDQGGSPYFYAALKTGGVQIFEATQGQDPVPESIVPTSALGGLEVMNLTQQGDYLFLALGNFFGANPQQAGIGIVDISDPELPFVTDYWMTDSIVKGTAVILVEGEYAYLGAMNQGLMIFDISDKENINKVGAYLPDIHFPVEDPNSVQEPNARGMALRDELLYLCYDAGGLRLIDVSNSAQPIEVGRYINEDVLHKQQAYNNVILKGDYAYIALDYCGLEIVDISNIDNISRVAWWNPWGCELASNIWLNSPGHTNQLAFSEDQSIIFLSAGGSELLAVDISDPTNPNLCGTYGETGNQLGVWGLGIQDNTIALAYINAIIPFSGTWSGIKVLNWDIISDVYEARLNTQIEAVYPKPFNDQIYVKLNLTSLAEIQIEIVDLRGRKIKQYPNQRYLTGEHLIKIAAQDIPPGIYFLTLKNDSAIHTQKVVKAGL